MSIKISKKNDLKLQEIKLYCDKKSLDEALSLIFDTFSDQIEDMIKNGKAKLSQDTEIKSKKKVTA